VAEIIANHTDWPSLYDPEQLRNNEVPVYAATYVDDMYVHCELAMKTASLIRNCKHFVTNTMYHNALRANADELFRQLFALRDDTLD
jgi:proline iminopeptidase